MSHTPIFNVGEASRGIGWRRGRHAAGQAELTESHDYS